MGDTPGEKKATVADVVGDASASSTAVSGTVGGYRGLASATGEKSVLQAIDSFNNQRSEFILSQNAEYVKHVKSAAGSTEVPVAENRASTSAVQKVGDSYITTDSRQWTSWNRIPGRDSVSAPISDIYSGEAMFTAGHAINPQVDSTNDARGARFIESELNKALHDNIRGINSRTKTTLLSKVINSEAYKRLSALFTSEGVIPSVGGQAIFGTMGVLSIISALKAFFDVVDLIAAQLGVSSGLMFYGTAQIMWGMLDLILNGGISSDEDDDDNCPCKPLAPIVNGGIVNMSDPTRQYYFTVTAAGDCLPDGSPIGDGTIDEKAATIYKGGVTLIGTENGKRYSLWWGVIDSGTIAGIFSIFIRPADNIVAGIYRIRIDWGGLYGCSNYIDSPLTIVYDEFVVPSITITSITPSVVNNTDGNTQFTISGSGFAGLKRNWSWDIYGKYMNGTNLGSSKITFTDKSIDGNTTIKCNLNPQAVGATGTFAVYISGTYTYNGRQYTVSSTGTVLLTIALQCSHPPHMSIPSKSLKTNQTVTIDVTGSNLENTYDVTFINKNDTSITFTGKFTAYSRAGIEYSDSGFITTTTPHDSNYAGTYKGVIHSSPCNADVIIDGDITINAATNPCTPTDKPELHATESAIIYLTTQFTKCPGTPLMSTIRNSFVISDLQIITKTGQVKNVDNSYIQDTAITGDDLKDYFNVSIKIAYPTIGQLNHIKFTYDSGISVVIPQPISFEYSYNEVSR